MSGKRVPLEERFWRKVDKRGPVHPTLRSRCWLWLGCIDQRGGYGRVSVRREEATKKAHRIAYELVNGRIAPGMCILHRCDNPRCVRPEHLVEGTQRANVYDAIAKGRHTTPQPWDGTRRVT